VKKTVNSIHQGLSGKMNDELLITLKAVSNILKELIDKLETPPPLEVIAIEEVKPESDIGG
jgi:hypothetical protein